MVEREDHKIIGLAIVLLLCWMGYSPLACEGAVVWEDNFDDGNYIGWTICENPAVCAGSNWSATNQYLELNQSGTGLISHLSSVAYGTWSFDAKVQESLFTQVVFISSNDVADLDDINDWVGYWVNFAPSGDNFVLSLRKNSGGGMTIIDSYETPIPAADWHHIEVTRTTAGRFSVSHNGSLIMQGVDTEIDTSVMFAFYARFGQMFDNIVVDDQPPSGFPVWWWFVIAGVSVILVVVVLVIIRKRK